jgi:hypothetical protein
MSATSPRSVGAGVGVEGGGDAGLTVGGEHRRACVGGEFRDGPAGVFVDRPADRVLHVHAGVVAVGFAVEGGDPGQQLVGGAGAVGGDEQVVPPGLGDLGDGAGEQGDVVVGVVGAGGAAAELFG